MRTARLKVQGGSLYYEVRGSGPVLLMIPGGPDDSSDFQPIADQLADSHTVLTYDCRGNSRSPMTGPREELTVDLAAEDARRLLAAVSSGPADVLGSSGGATYGLALVAHYPDLIRTLVAHEPPVSELLLDAPRWRANNAHVGEICRKDGVGPALSWFVDCLFGAQPDGSPGPAEPAVEPTAVPTTDAEESMVRRNLELFASHTIPNVVGNYRPDLASLRAASTRIVVGIGAESLPHHLTYRTSHALAEQLGVELVEFPGAHGGFASDPAEFATRLRAVLARTG
jgi:pimeloyl-ACP methyl ester carboxylesterase